MRGRGQRTATGAVAAAVAPAAAVAHNRHVPAPHLRPGAPPQKRPRNGQETETETDAETAAVTAAVTAVAAVALYTHRVARNTGRSCEVQPGSLKATEGPT